MPLGKAWTFRGWVYPAGTTLGPTAPQVARVSIAADEDHDPGTNLLDPAHGWRVFPVTLDAGVTWFAARTGQASATLGDVDIYLLRDANGDGQFDWATERVAVSRSLGVNDEVQVEAPAPGGYVLAVHAYRGDGEFDLRTWTVRAGSDSAASPHLAVIPPAGVLQAAVAYTPRLAWTGITQAGETYYGLVRLAAAGQPLGPNILVAIDRLADGELTKTASAATVEAGQPVTYTISITNFDRQATPYVLTDPLPAGLALAPDSLQRATYDPTTRTLRETFDLRGARDAIEFGAGSVAQSPLGRYVDLPTEVGTAPLSQGSDGDDVGVDWDLPVGVPGFPYFGGTYRRLGLVTNGYIVLGGIQGPSDIQFRNTPLPNVARPNAVLAPFWTDLALSHNRLGHGEWYADVVTGGALGTQHAVVVQWKEVAHRQVRDSRFSFEVVLVLETGAVSYLYDAMAGQVDRVTIGAEDETGTRGNSWHVNGTPADHAPTGSAALMLDIQPSLERYAQRVVRYQARPVVAGVITNTVELDKGSAVGQASASAAVTAHGYTLFLPWLRR